MKEDEGPEDFKKDRGDGDADCGIAAALTDAECRRIATVSAEDEELEDLTTAAAATPEFKDRGAPPLREEMMLVVVREPGAALALIGVEV